MLDSSFMDTQEKAQSKIVEALFKVGAHFGYNKSRRHPSSSHYIFGAKNKVEIFDLEETEKALESAKSFVKSIGSTGKQILFVAGKNEAKEVVKSAAESAGLPFVAGRFIGGSLTNFSEIRKRIDRLERLLSERASGELTKYTKKERLLIDREIVELEDRFGGIVSMRSLPAAVFVIDSKKEHIAIAEARHMNIPTIALTNSDCDISLVNYPIPGNDALKSSIEYFVNEIASAYKEGSKEQKKETPVADSPVV